MFNMTSRVALEAKAYLLGVNIIILAPLFYCPVAGLSAGETENNLGKRMRLNFLAMKQGQAATICFTSWGFRGSGL